MTRIEACPVLPASLLANARVLADRDAILPLLPKGGVIVEVGVALGDFSRKFLDVCAPSHFVAIDSFRIHDYAMLWGRPTREIFDGATHGDFYRARFADWLAQGRMQVLEADSAAALQRLDDRSVDVFYVDADHTYEAVRRELSIIRDKVKDDGWIVMNDYTMVDVVGGQMEPYGVIHATNAFMLADAWEMTYFALQNYMYCDVVLRRLSPDRAAAFRATHVPAPPVAVTIQPTEPGPEVPALQAKFSAQGASTSWRSPLRAVSRLLRGG